jgi:hypothetical protein
MLSHQDKIGAPAKKNSAATHGMRAKSTHSALTG